MKNVMVAILKAKRMLIVLAIFSAATAGSMAQSGRSVPKPPPASPAPTTAPTPAAKRPTPLYTVKVISDIQPDAYFGFPKPEYMHTWAIERLKKSPVLDVIDGGLENRRDAINKAKEETEVYVVLLQLEPLPGLVPTGARAAGMVRIFLSVLSPRTGKAKYTKWIALNEMRKENPPLNTCHTGVFGNDYWLLEASIRAADHVMSSFNLTIPPDFPK